MAESKRSIGWLVILALLAALLAALNPTMDDFKAWRAARAQDAAVSPDSTGIERAFETGAGAVAGLLEEIGSGAYRRTNYVVCSAFGSGGSKGPLYLGIARTFVKLR
jgi:hypothetical protein